MSDKKRREQRAIEALENGGRILITRLQYLGDVVLTLPLVDAVRRRFPDAEVDYLCRPPSSELLSGDPRFARVFTQRPQSGAAESISLIHRLRSRRYDAVIDLYSNPRSAWLARFTGAKTRIGGDRRGRRFLYTSPVTVAPEVRSALEHHLRYAEPLDVPLEACKPALTVSPVEVEAARDLLERSGVETRRPDRPRIGIHPGGKWEVKRWPVSSFVRLGRTLRDNWDADVVVFTGPGEARFTDLVADEAGEAGDGVSVLPEINVRLVAAVLSLLDGMVVSDGGIMHLSVAVGTPTVGLFGSAEPDIWFPYGTMGPFAAAYVPIECRPCHQHVCPLGHTACLADLTPESVAESLQRVLAGQGGALESSGDGG
jgi:lipopolysaccharide heptosyltransferase II